MLIIRNPFIINGYISPTYFCDRKAESEMLIRQITNGNNTALISTRRMGKTGLIRHCFQSKEIQHITHSLLIYMRPNLCVNLCLLSAKKLSSH